MIGSAFIWGLRWLVRKIGIETIIPFSLLAFTLFSLIFGLQNILIKINSGELVFTALLALLLGWLMAKTLAKHLVSIVTAILSGLFVVLANTLNLWFLFYLLLLESITYAWRSLWVYTGKPMPAASEIFLLWGDISAKSSSLLTRTTHWFTDLFSGRTNYDANAAVFLWGLGVWLVAGWASWWYRRTHQVIPSLLPAGVLFASSLSYARASIYFLVPFIAGLFFLSAWNQYSTLQDQWQRRQTDVADGLLPDIGMWITAISVTVILASAFVSLVSPQSIFRTAREYAAQNIGDSQEIGQALGLQVQPPSNDRTSLNDPGILPRRHLIGSPPELSRQVALIITMDRPDVEQAEIDEEHFPQQLYFKSMSFDQYTGRGWKTSSTMRQEFQASQELVTGAADNHLLITQTIQFGLQPGRALYYVGVPFKVSQATVMERRETSDHQIDLYALSSKKSSQVDHLIIQSLYPKVGEIQLREAHQNYPQWVLDRYLQLPQELPNEVRELASQITQNLTNPYDQARAIEMYLRSYPYSLQIPPPPEGGDISAYFLFELKTGYCDYYATAMTVLARAAGIPARLVMGYAGGLYNPEEKRHILTAANAHSWVEIYFPGFGWIEFEPTAALDSIARLSDVAIEQQQEITLQPTPQQEFSIRYQTLALLAAAIIASLFILSSMVIFIEKHRLSRLTPTLAASMVFQGFVKLARSLNIQTQPNPTPNEWLNDFSNHPDLNKQNSLFHLLLRNEASKLQAIIENYNLASYSLLSVNQEQQQASIQSWFSIRMRLALLIIWKKIKELLRRMKIS